MCFGLIRFSKIIFCDADNLKLKEQGFLNSIAMCFPYIERSFLLTSFAVNQLPLLGLLQRFYRFTGIKQMVTFTGFCKRFFQDSMNLFRF